MQNPGFQSTVKRAARHGITLPCPGRVQHLRVGTYFRTGQAGIIRVFVLRGYLCMAGLEIALWAAVALVKLSSGLVSCFYGLAGG